MACTTPTILLENAAPARKLALAIASRASFEVTHRNFIRRICALRDEIRTNEKLAERIRYKYSIKNVTGLNLLPFVRFDDPFEIIAHLMVGSEGTLAFLSEVTMKT